MEIGVSIEIDASALDGALKVLQPFLEFDGAELMSIIGAAGESQTRRRIAEEKTGPDGSVWPPNLKGTSILVETGQHLLYSISHRSDESSAEWGSGWEYAHVHQDGMRITPRNAKLLAVPAAAFGAGGGVRFAKAVTIPARPFVGLSSDNRDEIVDVVTDYFGVAQ